MSERVLEISEKAMETLHKMGDEAFVIMRRLGSG